MHSNKCFSKSHSHIARLMLAALFTCTTNATDYVTRNELDARCKATERKLRNELDVRCKATERKLLQTVVDSLNMKGDLLEKKIDTKLRDSEASILTEVVKTVNKVTDQSNGKLRKLTKKVEQLTTNMGDLQGKIEVYNPLDGQEGMVEFLPIEEGYPIGEQMVVMKRSMVERIVKIAENIKGVAGEAKPANYCRRRMPELQETSDSYFVMFLGMMVVNLVFLVTFVLMFRELRKRAKEIPHPLSA